jgi:hypothetical protein
MSYDRGDVVVAFDPFTDGSSGRPFLIVGHEKTPFHEEQYIALSLSHHSNVIRGPDPAG